MDFVESKQKEDKACEVIIPYLQAKYKDFEDVRDIKRYQDRDVDFIINNKELEVKCDDRIGETNNVCLEFISNDVRGTPGCFMKSKAEYRLIYDCNNKIGYMFNLMQAKQWIMQGQQLRTAKHNNTRFTSYSWIIPLREFERNIKVYHLDFN